LKGETIISRRKLQMTTDQGLLVNQQAGH
jgi:hypothetical protein